jgi:dihydropyrimidinase
VTGLPSHTISQGEVVYIDGALRAVRSKGRYVKRPAFHPVFDAMARAPARKQRTRIERTDRPS